jgi:hypothetical protein
MKTKNLINSIFAVVFTCMGIAAVAQPSWSVSPNLYDYSMTVTGKIFIDGTLLDEEDDLIAAFIGGECRGVVNVKHQTNLKDYFVFLMIYSNTPTGSISFKVFDASENKEFDVSSTLNFSINSIVGSVISPHQFNVVTKTYEARILMFTIPDQEGSTSISNSTVALTQKVTGDLSQIAAVFTLSDGAKAYVKDVLQVSGSTVNDFRNLVQYKIVPISGEPRYYWVSVTKAIDMSTKILLSNIAVPENKDSALVGILMAQSEVLGSSYEFSFENVSGADNQLFYLDGDKLHVKNAFNYEHKPHYMVSIKVANNNGISKQSVFDIDVLNRNDPPTDISLSANTIKEATSENEFVSRLIVEDEDKSDLHFFKLKPGNGINDEANSYFSIRGDSLFLKEKIGTFGKEYLKIVVEVADSSGATFGKELSLQIVNMNNAPQFLSKPLSYAIQNQVYVYQIQVEDKEGDNLKISFDGLPEWLTFKENTGLLSGIPHNNHVGDTEFNVMVSDGVKATVQKVVISVLNINDPPEIKEYPVTQYFFTGKENLISLAGAITDPDVDDKLIFQLSTENNSALPDWMKFDPLTLTLTANPPGDKRGIYNLKLTATDSGGSKEYVFFSIEVSFPTAIDDQAKSINFRLFPNPFQNSLYIDVPVGDDATVSMSNVAGQTIKTYRLSPGLAREIPMNGIEPGIYIIRFRQSESEQIQKVIKQ